MSNQTYKVDRYSSVKNTFIQIASEIADAEFSENKDSLALKLSFKCEEQELDFYYIFGNSQVTAIEKTEIYVLSTEANALYIKVKNMIETFVKNKIKEKQKNN